MFPQACTVNVDIFEDILWNSTYMWKGECEVRVSIQVEVSNWSGKYNLFVLLLGYCNC